MKRKKGNEDLCLKEGRGGGDRIHTRGLLKDNPRDGGKSWFNGLKKERKGNGVFQERGWTVPATGGHSEKKEQLFWVRGGKKEGLFTLKKKKQGGEQGGGSFLATEEGHNLVLKGENHADPCSFEDRNEGDGSRRSVMKEEG